MSRHRASLKLLPLPLLLLLVALWARSSWDDDSDMRNDAAVSLSVCLCLALDSDTDNVTWRDVMLCDVTSRDICRGGKPADDEFNYYNDARPSTGTSVCPVFKTSCNRDRKKLSLKLSMI